MTNKKWIGSILGATIILFLWNAVSWMILPFHSNVLHNIPEHSFNVDSLENYISNDGVYHYPGLPLDNSPESIRRLNDKLNSGPRITLMVYKTGQTELFNFKSFLLSFLFNLLTSTFTLHILSKLKDTNWFAITTTSLIIGLIVCFAEILPQTTWYLFPFDYILIELIDCVVAFLLIGVLFKLYTFTHMSK